MPTRLFRSACFLTPAIAAFALIGAPAYSADYHVARNVSGASDTNNGLSIGSPFRTATKGLAMAKAGDTVYIYDGTYVEDYPKILASGTQGSPIVITAASGQNPVLTCRELNISGRSWITVRGLTLRGPKTLPSNWRDMPAVVVDDSSVRITPGEGWSTREAKVRRKYATFMTMLDQWKSTETKGITVIGGGNITLRGNTISHHTRGIMLTGGTSNVTVEQNRVSYCQFGIQAWASSGSTSLTDGLISNNDCAQNWDHSIYISGSPQRVQIRGNRCTDAAVNHIGMNDGSRACVVSRNHLERGGFYAETMRAPGASAISAYRVGVDCKIDGNFCAYQEDLTHYDGNGIIIDTSSNPVTVSNNTCYRNMGSGITQTLSSGCSIVNNTCAENGYNTTHAYNGVGIRFAKVSDDNAKVHNNIIYMNRRGGMMAADLSGQTSINYNVYTLASGTPVMRNGYSSGYTTLEAVRSSTSYEDNGRIGDPMFVNLAGVDLRLQAGSAAKDAGSASYAPALDGVGVARNGAPDCGAYEFVPVVVPPPPVVVSAFPLKIDFQPATAPAVAGWVIDSGLAFGKRGAQLFGWNTAVTAGVRDRNQISDQRRDTIAHMQHGGANSKWEVAVPAGTYLVRVVCGDAAFFDSTYRVNVEGTLVVNGRPTTGSRFVEGAATVVVSDGRLTLSNATGAVNNKICSVEIEKK